MLMLKKFNIYKTVQPIVELFNSHDIKYALTGSSVIVWMMNIDYQYGDIDFLVRQEDRERINDLFLEHEEYSEGFMPLHKDKKPHPISDSDCWGEIPGVGHVIAGYGIRADYKSEKLGLKLVLDNMITEEVNGIKCVPSWVLMEKYRVEMNAVKDSNDKDRMQILEKVMSYYEKKIKRSNKIKFLNNLSYDRL